MMTAAGRTASLCGAAEGSGRTAHLRHVAFPVEAGQEEVALPVVPATECLEDLGDLELKGHILDGPALGAQGL